MRRSTCVWLLLWLACCGQVLAGEVKPSDGQVVELKDDMASVDLRPGLVTTDGAVVFFYRVYPVLEDARDGSQLDGGETFMGRGMLQQVENGRALVRVPFLDLKPGDQLRLADEWVASTVANSAWVPEGRLLDYLKEPFLVPRTINNRVGVTTDVSIMGKKDEETGLRDYYYGTTIDFTFWPMLQGAGLDVVDYIRFGVGGFQGETKYIPADGDPTGRVRFIFGTAETDIRLGYFGLEPSVKLGLNNSGFGWGTGLKLRIGTLQNSHFLVGYELIRGVGGAGTAEMHHFPTRRLQFWVKGGFENLPAGGDRIAGKVQVGSEFKVTKELWIKASFGVGGRRSTEASERGMNGMLGFTYNFMTKKQ